MLCFRVKCLLCVGFKIAWMYILGKSTHFDIAYKTEHRNGTWLLG